MSILKRSADLVYTFRFLRLLTTAFEDTEAYKLGIIDENGNRIKNKSISNYDEKSAYTAFHRLVFNIKKLMAKVPSGGSRLASYAAALYLIKEKYGIKDSALKKALIEMNVNVDEIITESSSWFLLEDKQLSPGVYRLSEDKVLNQNCDDIVNRKDKIRVEEGSYPVGNVFGVDIYEATHVRSKQKIYVAVEELTR